MKNEDQAALVRKKLLQLSQKEGINDINQLRIIIAFERVIARISTVPELDDNIFYKGGFVLLKQANSIRFTKDLDAVVIDLTEKQLIKYLKKALSKDLGDGMWYGEITVESLPSAVRVTFPYQIGAPNLDKINKLSKAHLDIGIGNQERSFASKEKMISILDFNPSVSWKVLPKEYIIAEKLDAIVTRKDSNSRAKDIYDIVLLASSITDYSKVVKAIKNVFKDRATEMPKSFYSLYNSLNTEILQTAWGKLEKGTTSRNFKDCEKDLKKFLKEIDAFRQEQTLVTR